MISLPVLSCDGCGVCCDEQGTPPMIMEEYDALPAHLKWDREKHSFRYDNSQPCLWYDKATKRCVNYEHRGLACREFKMGGDDCLSMRNSRGITT